MRSELSDLVEGEADHLADLRCLKYVRRLETPIVSLIMRQLVERRWSGMRSCQVTSLGASVG